MPPRSEKQRRAMFAAASGKSTLGIPESVGKDFTSADPGGRLPESSARTPTKAPTPGGKGIRAMFSPKSAVGPKPKGKR